MISMVKRTKKEFKNYNEFHDREFGLKWGTAYALDDLMKGVRANEEYALKNNESRPQMSRQTLDSVLSEAFLHNKEVTIQLNLLDEYGRILDDLSGHFKGEAYQDYFVFNDQIIDWDDVRNIEIVTHSKWFDLDMFESSEKNKKPSTTSSEMILEKDDYYQPFFEEGENN